MVVRGTRGRERKTHPEEPFKVDAAGVERTVQVVYRVFDGVVLRDEVYEPAALRCCVVCGSEHVGVGRVAVQGQQRGAKFASVNVRTLLHPRTQAKCTKYFSNRRERKKERNNMHSAQTRTGYAQSSSSTRARPPRGRPCVSAPRRCARPRRRPRRAAPRPRGTRRARPPGAPSRRAARAPPRAGPPGARAAAPRRSPSPATATRARPRASRAPSRAASAAPGLGGAGGRGPTSAGPLPAGRPRPRRRAGPGAGRTAGRVAVVAAHRTGARMWEGRAAGAAARLVAVRHMVNAPPNYRQYAGA